MSVSTPEPELEADGLRALLSTVDRRFWLVAAVATIGSLLLLGVPSAVIPNPFFVRMTPTETFNVVVWLASAPLVGLLIATYVRPPGHGPGHEGGERGAGRVALGGLAAYLAIGCPICNKDRRGRPRRLRRPERLRAAAADHRDRKSVV
jgi:hypothetical protein